MKFKYLRFIGNLVNSDVEVHSHKGEYLGYIEKKQVGRFQHWCFNPNSNTYYTNGCLRELVKYIASLYSKKKHEVD